MIVDIFTINEFRVHPFVASTTRQALKAIDTSGLCRSVVIFFAQKRGCRVWSPGISCGISGLLNVFDAQNIPMVYIMTSWYSTIFNGASMGFLRDTKNGIFGGVGISEALDLEWIWFDGEDSPFMNSLDIFGMSIFGGVCINVHPDLDVDGRGLPGYIPKCPWKIMNYWTILNHW